MFQQIKIAILGEIVDAKERYKSSSIVLGDSLKIRYNV